MLKMLVDLGNILIGKLLDFLFRYFHLVLGYAARFAILLDVFDGIPAHMTNRDAPVFGHFLDDLDEFNPAFLAELRQHDADEFLVRYRVEPKVALLDGFLDWM